jgi:hypothetical protein
MNGSLIAILALNRESFQLTKAENKQNRQFIE